MYLEDMKMHSFSAFLFQSHPMTPPIGTFVLLLHGVVPQLQSATAPLKVLGKEGHFFARFCPIFLFQGPNISAVSVCCTNYLFSTGLII
jgi:hypothetical protein